MFDILVVVIEACSAAEDYPSPLYRQVEPDCLDCSFDFVICYNVGHPH